MLGVVAAGSVAACAFVIGVLVHKGLAEAGIWAGVVAALAAVVAAAAAVRVLVPQQSKVPLPPELEVPDWVVGRPAKLAAVVRALVGGRTGTVGITTGLYGAGGFGKTTLAQMVCADPRVRRRFGGRARTRPRRSSALSALPRQAGLGGCRRPGRRRRRTQGWGSGPVTHPVSGRCPRSCGGSKNTVCRSWPWQLLDATRTCPMPRPRPAASRAGCRGTASSSLAPCRATAGDRTDRIQAYFRTKKRTSKRSRPDRLPRVNHHRDVHG